jgi:hypothetical protein
MKILKNLLFSAVLCSLLFTNGCLPSGQSNKGGHIITVYGFSIMKEA